MDLTLSTSAVRSNPLPHGPVFGFLVRENLECELSGKLIDLNVSLALDDNLLILRFQFAGDSLSLCLDYTQLRRAVLDLGACCSRIEGSSKSNLTGIDPSTGYDHVRVWQTVKRQRSQLNGIRFRYRPSVSAVALSASFQNLTGTIRAEICLPRTYAKALLLDLEHGLENLES